MGRDRTQQATPDLFSTAAFRDSSLPAKKQDSSAQKQRHVLPKDLSNAVKHLNDQELDLTAPMIIAKIKVPPAAMAAFEIRIIFRQLSITSASSSMWASMCKICSCRSPSSSM